MSVFLKKYATEEKLNQAIENKIDKIDGKGLSTNDYTTEEKEKLSGIESGANKIEFESSYWNSSSRKVYSSKQVEDKFKLAIADWNANYDEDGFQGNEYIKNKPFYSKSENLVLHPNDSYRNDNGDYYFPDEPYFINVNGENVYRMEGVQYYEPSKIFEQIDKVYQKYNGSEGYFTFDIWPIDISSGEYLSEESFEVFPYKGEDEDILYFGNPLCLNDQNIQNKPELENSIPYAFCITPNSTEFFTTESSYAYSTIHFSYNITVIEKKLDNKFLDIDPTLSISGAPADAAAVSDYVDTKVANLVNSAPETLDTLGEVATALAENEEVVEALNSAIGNKVDKIEGKGLSTNDYTTEEKEKLADVESGANKTTITTSMWASSDTTVMSSSAVQRALEYSVADWEELADGSYSFIKNKPFYEVEGEESIYGEDYSDGEDDGYIDLSDAEVISTANGENLYYVPLNGFGIEMCFDIVYDNPDLYTANFSINVSIHHEESFSWEVIPYIRTMDNVKSIYFGNASCLPDILITDAPETNCPYAIQLKYDNETYTGNFYTKDNSKVFDNINFFLTYTKLKKLDNKFLDIDSTLSISGAPADAAAVSEAIENIEMVGKDVTGETLILPTGSQETAQEYAEIFNDYENNVATGRYSHAEGSYAVALSDYSHAEGYYTMAEEEYSHAENYKTEASGIGSHAEGYETKAQADYSHTEGYQTEVYLYAQGGHAEGYKTLAKGFKGSHAEGIGTTASGSYASHAEGYYTVASGSYAHAEGTYTNATNTAAHAEGSETTASGEYSHAEGEGTIASAKGQHVEGKYNIDDPSSIHITGNGTSKTERSNAYTLNLNGEAWFSGDVYTGSTSGTNKDEGSKKLATEEYVEEQVSSIIQSIDVVNTRIDNLFLETTEEEITSLFTE